MMSAKMATTALLKIKIITSYILPITSQAEVCHMTQITTLWMWSCDQTLVTLALV